MKRLILICIFFISFVAAQTYCAGEQVSLSHQNLEHTVGAAMDGYEVGDVFKLADYNGDLNGGSYSGEKSVHERRDRHMIHATKEGYTDVVMDVIAKYKKMYHKRRRWPLVLNKLLLTVKDLDDNTLLHLELALLNYLDI